MNENIRIDTAEDSKEKQAEGRISARWLERSVIISRRIKTRRTRRIVKKMEDKREGEKEKGGGRETSGKNGEMARKEMKMKRAR